ncbi:cytochrome P450 [Entophlyctis helioformis]|nr:cytochrome P450 [Entophlyctis helioformis]
MRLHSRLRSCLHSRLHSCAHRGLLEGALFMISEADKWKRHRTLLQPAFNPTNLRYTAVATTAVMDVVAAELRSRSLESEAMGVEINVLDYTSAIALDVFGKVAFSKDFDTVKDLQSFTRGKDREMLERLVDIISQRFEVPIRFWPLAGLASTSPQVVETREYTHNLVKGFIRERREAMARGERLGLGKWDMDLLDRLLQDSMNASATDDKLSETEIVGETLGLFLAGQQTTASAMSHIILSLCHNPKAMALLVQEIDTVYAKINGEITTDNLHLFQYLDWCVKESLRLYEVIGLVSRYSTTEVQVLGHTFPKGAMFLAHGHAMARDPRYFPNPTEYIPERWATPPVVGSYIPFGDGPTVCIGQKLTNIEMRVAMIHLFRQFSVKLVEGQDIEFVMDLSVSIKNGYKVLVTARK